jgi:hypothetical protein
MLGKSMFYKYKDELINISKIIKVAPLENCFRFWFYELEKPIPAKKFLGITTKEEVPAGFYKKGFLEADTLVSREQAIYDGRYVRVWYDPSTVKSWNYGVDYKFNTPEEASAFLKACAAYSEKCKFEDNK